MHLPGRFEGDVGESDGGNGEAAIVECGVDAVGIGKFDNGLGELAFAGLGLVECGEGRAETGEAVGEFVVTSPGRERPGFSLRAANGTAKETSWFAACFAAKAPHAAIGGPPTVEIEVCSSLA